MSWNSDGFTHDPDGNLTGISGSRRFSGTYDPENRLTNVTWNDGTTTVYVYDGLGYRVQTQSANGTSTLYHDSAGRLLDRIDPSQALTHYLYADGRLIASGSAAQGYVFYHFDKTGNTLAITDTTGQVVGAYAYDTFGKVVAHSGLTTLFTYVGAYGVIGVNDNLFFMQNRFYDANTGSFIQRDPIAFAGGQSNLYAYVANNPIIWVNPKGLSLFEIAIWAADKSTVVYLAPFERPDRIWGLIKQMYIVETEKCPTKAVIKLILENTKILISPYVPVAGNLAIEITQDLLERYLSSIDIHYLNKTLYIDRNGRPSINFTHVGHRY